jgi:hypothetical protein
LHVGHPVIVEERRGDFADPAAEAQHGSSPRPALRPGPPAINQLRMAMATSPVERTRVPHGPRP